MSFKLVVAAKTKISDDRQEGSSISRDPRMTARGSRASGFFFAVATRRKRKLLLRGLLQRRNPGQDHLDPRAAAGRRIEVEPAAQAVGHDVVDDMQTEPGAALIAAGREERIKRPAPHPPAHAPTPLHVN